MREREFSPEQEKKGAELEPRVFELNGRTVEMYGIYHGRGQFEKAKHSLEQAVQRASAVVIEAAPTAEGVYSNEVQDSIHEWLRSQGVNADDEEIESFIQRLQANPHLQFYSEVEKLAAQAEKPLVVVDPRLSRNAMHGRFEEKEQQVALMKKLGAAGASGVFLGSELYSFIKNRSGKQPEKQRKSKRKMSRREVLGLGGKALAGAAALAMFGSLAAERSEPKGPIQTNRGRTENPYGPLLYDLLDYRDVEVARGLHKATKENFKGGPLVVIYGDSHLEAIQHYAKSDTEREAKHISYLPFRKVDPPKFRLYRWDAEASEWVSEKSKAIS